jgi:hypothetical protein
MKFIIIFLLLFLPVSVFVQGEKLKIVVMNKKEQPVKSVIVETIPQSGEFRTDKSGVCILENLTDVDSIMISFPGSSIKGAYALNSIEELHFSTSKSELEAFDPISGTWLTGKEKRIIKKGEFDVSYEITAGAKNLEDLLKRMPQLMVTGGEISLRNPVQTAQFSNTSPLIVVDGFPVRGGLAEANKIVNIHSIESIEVLRDGTLYGREALNGAIVIRLKK